MSDPVRDLTERLARLEAEVESLREENRSLQGRVARPGPRTSPAEPRSRRAFLARAGAVAAGAGGLMAFQSLTRTSPAHATVGMMFFGTTNDAGADATTLASTAAVAFTGHSLSPTGTGVKGVGETGIAGLALITDGTGVRGEAVVPGGTGVRGIASNGSGVHGSSSAAAGVRGRSDTGTGVVGESPIGTGVVGESTNGTGVHGGSDLQDGVVGESRFGDGVVGVIAEVLGSGAGVRGQTSGSGSGVRGETSGSGSAVLGTNTNAASTAGVQGNASGSTRGVYGLHTGTSKKGVGIYGESEGGRGGVFSGKVAQLKLVPSADQTKPSKGQKGDLFVDKVGRLWYCRGGTNWVQLA